MSTTIPLRLQIPIEGDLKYLEFANELKKKRLLSPLLTALMKSSVKDMEINTFVMHHIRDKFSDMATLPTYFRKLVTATISVQFKLTNDIEVDDVVRTYRQEELLVPYLSTLLQLFYASISYRTLFNDFLANNVAPISFAEVVALIPNDTDKASVAAIGTSSVSDKEFEEMKAKCAELEKQIITMSEQMNTYKLLNGKLEEDVRYLRTTNDSLVSQLLSSSQRVNEVPIYVERQSPVSSGVTQQPIHNTSTIPVQPLESASPTVQGHTNVQSPEPVQVQPMQQPVTQPTQPMAQPLQQQHPVATAVAQQQTQPTEPPVVDAMAAFKKSKNSLKNL